MTILIHELRLFFVALQFLTRVPTPGWGGWKPEWLHASARYFPLVGAAVGVSSALVLWASSLCLPHSVAVILAVLSSLILTGAFHEDGLADTFDALGGLVSKERALQIMKDSRIGTYGAVALVTALLLKTTLLNHMPLPVAMSLTVLAHSASRAAAVVLMCALPYAGDAEHIKAKPMAHQVPWSIGVMSFVWPLLLTLILGFTESVRWSVLVAGWIALVIATLLCARWWQCRLNGITGDTLGATQQITELAVLLLALSAAIHH
jgi:adenosylcobinamide-GDP ribazoletransferase